MMKVTLLGATGSIGQNTLDVISRNLDKYQVFAISANQNINLLLKQIKQFAPQYAVVKDEAGAERLYQQIQQLALPTKILQGEQALLNIASHPETDCVLAAIVGAAGLLPTLAAARAGKRILLANKESLVMSGSLLMQAVQEHNAVLLPIDSEHNAIFQCISAQGNSKKQQGIHRIILTASGGPFRDWPLTRLSEATPAQACAHPNWNMGKKVSVDSATMMNKALEVIEAHWLFNQPAEKISVMLHPQSTVHSMVEYIDGSVLAQLGNPDMRTPIANALAWPERIDAGVNNLDLIKIGRLDFAPLCLDRYPSLQLAYKALELGGTAATTLNAANEIAVENFLNETISFTDIYQINKKVLEDLPVFSNNLTLENILSADTAAREFAQNLFSKAI